MIPSAQDCEALASPVLSKPVMGWQRSWWHAACAPERDLICLSMARGGGKTATAAALAAAWFRQLSGGDIVIAASSFEQGKLLGRDARSMLQASNVDKIVVRDSNARFEIEHKPSGTRLRVIGSNPGRAQGLRPALIVADEPASWPRPSASELLSVLLTARGKIDGSRMIILGTRAGDPQHFWERLLAEPGPRSHVTLFAAKPDCDLSEESEWHKANPSLAHNLPNIEQIRGEATEAERDSAQAQRFRALRLNSGVDVVEKATSILAPGVWADLEDAPNNVEELSDEYCLGLDLGGSVSLSAAAAYWPDTGRLDVLAAIGGVPSLVERGKQFGSPHLFVDAARDGHLLVSKNRNADPAALLSQAIMRWGIPEIIVADRYRNTELLDLVDELGVNCEIEWRGAGWKDASSDCRRFIRSCHSRKVSPVRTELLDASIASARLVVDTAGNQKLGHRADRPDDLCAASILACAEGDRRGAARPTLRFARI